MNRIEPGRVSHEVVTTYDIFSTVLKVRVIRYSSHCVWHPDVWFQLADVEEPKDRVIDGRDMSPILFENGKTSHDCLFIYKGTPNSSIIRKI